MVAAWVVSRRDQGHCAVPPLFALVQDTPNEFELTADVLGVDGRGQAGVEARVFRGTGSDPGQAIEQGIIGGAVEN